MLNGMLATLPLDDESKERLRDDIRELEHALGCIVLNLEDAELRQLEALPDILERLQLFMARAALLYTLGYSEILREDGSIPKEETDEGACDLFSMLASQPLARQTRGPLIVHGQARQKLSATILGMTVEIEFEGSDQMTVVAEVILGSLEAFFATAIDERVIPHTEKFRINLIHAADGSELEIKTNALDMSATISWPAGVALPNRERHTDIHRFLAEVSGHVLATTCVVDDVKSLLDKLYEDDAVQHRISIVMAAPNSYHRIASRYLSRLSDWHDVVQKRYPPKPPRPQLRIVELKVPESERDDESKSHRGLQVRSVIDAYAWDRADWVGTLYAQVGPIPGIAFMFKDREAGRKIFERWRERFGSADEKEEIYLAVVRHLPDQNPSNYVLLVTSYLTESERLDPDHSIVMTSRSMTMTPESPANLERFLAAYEQAGAFCIMPAVIVNGIPEMLSEVAILKRRISVKEAASVGERDLEIMAVRPRRPRADSSGKAAAG
jgi:hypothetical protein